MQKVIGLLLCAVVATAVLSGCDSGETVSTRDNDVFQPLNVEGPINASERAPEPTKVAASSRVHTCQIHVVPIDARVLIEPAPSVSSNQPGSYEFDVPENTSFQLTITSEGREKFQQIIKHEETDVKLYIWLGPDFQWWLADAQRKFESGDLSGAWTSLGVARAVNAKNVSTEPLEQQLRLALTPTLTPKASETSEPELSSTAADPLFSVRRLIDARIYDAAMLLIDDRLEDDPLDSSALAARGYCLFKQGRIHEAVQVLSDVVDRQPDHYWAIFYRGVAMVELFQPDLATADFRRCLELAAEPAESLHYYLGLSLEQLGRSDEAIEHYSSALRINPDHTASRLNRCVLLLAEGSTEEAIDDASSILANQPTHPIALNSRGVAYAVRGETESAIDDFSAVIKAEPDYVEPRFNRAIGYLKSHHYIESVEDFSVAVQSDPDEPEFRIGRARAWMQLGEFEKAGDDLAVALERKPSDPNAIQLQQIVQRSIDQAD